MLESNPSAHGRKGKAAGQVNYHPPGRAWPACASAFAVKR